jgi:quercetin 2,3-dioxygenase
MTSRPVQQILTGTPASDGGGVKLTRVFSPGRRLDPFLLLDEFNSDEAADYLAGFPPHPHRGFETVTYMLEGCMRHEDHLGNQGLLTSGAVQWMTAARGIIHSEMPQQEEGRMRGFQLWINLPAAEKMKEPGYRDIPPERIPAVTLSGVEVKVIAGSFAHAGETTTGAVHGLSTDPLYLDAALAPEARLEVPVTRGHMVLAYAYEGAAQIGGQSLERGRLAVLGDGDTVVLHADAVGARVLLLAGKPLHEPVAHYGPFVMNTREEVEQAMRDYQAGRLTR